MKSIFSNNYVFMILVFLVCFTSLSINSQSISEDPDEMINEGIKLLNDGKYTEAENLLQSALKLNKFSHEAYYNLALIYALYAQVAIDEDSKDQLISKTIDYLNYSVSTGLRSDDMIIREKRFEIIRSHEGYTKVLKDIEYLKIKEEHWIDSEPFVTDVRFPSNKESGSKLPLLIYLKSDNKIENESFNPANFVKDYSMVCALLSYSTGEYDVRGGRWTEFSDKRIRKTLADIEEKNNLSSFIDFRKVYICGTRQAGYRALVTYLSYPDKFTGTFTFNTPIFENSEVYKKLKESENKKNLKIFAVHSKDDTLSFEKTKKSWEELIKSGVPAEFKIEEGKIFGNDTDNKYKKVLFDFINQDLPVIEKPSEKPQTQENKPEENDQ